MRSCMRGCIIRYFPPAQEVVRQNKVCIPGCNTPSEMYNAHSLGAQFQTGSNR